MSEKKKETINMQRNPNIPTLFADNLFIQGRSDGFFLLSFSAELPEGHVEQARVMALKEKLLPMIDVLCSMADHYPKKPKSKEKPKK